MPTLRELTEYHKPSTLDEALKLLRRTRVKTVPLAGGTSLVPEAAHDVQAVVDLSALGLSFIKTAEVSENLRGLERLPASERSARRRQNYLRLHHVSMAWLPVSARHRRIAAAVC